jgi:serralysin
MTSPNQPNDEANLNPMGQPANAKYWCFAPLAERTAGPGLDRATLLRVAKWTPGDIITVSFLQGERKLQQKVKDVALAWTAPGMANLTLEFRKDTTDTAIRIAFIPGNGSWSYVGTTCKQIPHPQATMNYGWLDRHSTDEEIRRVVLHEFGHALGMVHEHQNPEGCLKWNFGQVIQELSGPPNNWPLEVIIRNVFQVHAAAETNFTDLDENSIMMYPLPASWTLDGFSIPLNSELSELDKAFIRDQYP